MVLSRTIFIKEYHSLGKKARLSWTKFMIKNLTSISNPAKIVCKSKVFEYLLFLATYRRNYKSKSKNESKLLHIIGRRLKCTKGLFCTEGQICTMTLLHENTFAWRQFWTRGHFCTMTILHKDNFPQVENFKFDIFLLNLSDH